MSTLPSDEPKNGDFVAYLAEIEKRQLEAMRRNVPPAPPGMGAQAPSPGSTERRPLGPDEAKQLVERLRAGGSPLKPQDLLRIALGVVALLIGLFGEGGIVALVAAAVLLWQPLQRIAALVRGAGQAAAAQKPARTAFGRSRGIGKPGGRT